MYTSAEYMKIDKKNKKHGLDRIKNKKTITNTNVEEVMWTPRIRLIYIIHLIFRFGLEVFFLYLTYLLQKQQSKKAGIAALWVPEKYECTHGATEASSACSQNPLIPCWVSRPWEKTIFLHYMLIVTILSIFVCFAEVIYVMMRTSSKGYKNIKEKSEKKKEMKKSLIHNMVR